MPRASTRTSLEVPVQRVAEFVPASFTAALDPDTGEVLDKEHNTLVQDTTRWYHTGDNMVSLVIGEESYDFRIDALSALCEAIEALEITNLEDVLGI